MKVSIVYVTLDDQFIKELEIAEDSSVQYAIEQSNVLQEYSEISLDENQVGIFNELVSLDTKLKENDRIEIYRPLTMDPMQARRLRQKNQWS